ncbi:hypothetical protein CLF_111368 [Clonorchis sinensis]|uniref:Uncharacterized protein n=1 Tax=Clonorchis sinensis TaxID=79923 RepID=G7YUQ8_CLOSI|nr:hypothetical protein CLF_111368 [Clonorchis sinensis]
MASTATKVVFSFKSVDFETNLEVLHPFPSECRQLRGDLVLTDVVFEQGLANRFSPSTPLMHDRNIVCAIVLHPSGSLNHKFELILRGPGLILGEPAQPYSIRKVIFAIRCFKPEPPVRIFEITPRYFCQAGSKQSLEKSKTKKPQPPDKISLEFCQLKNCQVPTRESRSIQAVRPSYTWHSSQITHLKVPENYYISAQGLSSKQWKLTNPHPKITWGIISLAKRRLISNILSTIIYGQACLLSGVAGQQEEIKLSSPTKAETSGPRETFDGVPTPQRVTTAKYYELYAPLQT